MVDTPVIQGRDYVRLRAAGRVGETPFNARHRVVDSALSTIIGHRRLCVKPSGLLILILILAPAVSRQLSDEAKAWVPWLIRCLGQRAVRKLPADERERFVEEWPARVDEIPGDAGKLVFAMWLASRRAPRASISEGAMNGAGFDGYRWRWRGSLGRLWRGGGAVGYWLRAVHGAGRTGGRGRNLMPDARAAEQRDT
jgi:hypothetical protein